MKPQQMPWARFSHILQHDILKYRIGAVATGLVSQLREPVFESCAAVSNLGQYCSLFIAPVHSAVYLATDGGEYLCRNSLRALIAAWLDAFPGSRDGV